MTSIELSAREVGERGEALYEARVRSLVEDKYRGKFLVLDIETGDYEVGMDILTLTHLLHRRRPNAPLYSLRVGYPTTGRLGGRFSEAAP